MALKDRIQTDINRVFFNMDHFAEKHFWDYAEITCMIDDEELLKRKNNNVNDISWDPNIHEILVYTPVDNLPRPPIPNSFVIFDRAQYRILDVEVNAGVYAITLTATEARAVVY